jgi:hypothetical protein
VLCEAAPRDNTDGLSRLAVAFNIVRSRTGEKDRTLQEVIELTLRATQEQELFPPEDWELIRWLAENYRTANPRPIPCSSMASNCSAGWCAGGASSACSPPPTSNPSSFAVASPASSTRSTTATTN